MTVQDVENAGAREKLATIEDLEIMEIKWRTQQTEMTRNHNKL